MKNESKRRRLLAALTIIAVTVLAVVCFLIIQHLKGSQEAVSGGDTKHRMYVTVIDVGQGDSLLITLDSGEAMLIDAGEASDTGAVLDELDEYGVTDVDVLVATHPHADHIGGMRSVIDNYPVGQMLMPDKTSDSKTYQQMMDAVDTHNIPVIEAAAGYEFTLGNAFCTVVSPNAGADEDANNESVVIFLDYYDTEFLFAGDMEKQAEDAVLDAGYNIDADVLKVAHHGSSTSTTEAFLNAVTPDYAVISCGAGNSYGHPHQQTLDALNAIGARLYRTDLSGNVLFISDGETLTVRTGD